MVLAVGLAALGVVAAPGGSAVIAGSPPDCTSTPPSLVGGFYEIDTPGKLLHVANDATLKSASLLQTADLDLTLCGNWPGIGIQAAKFTGSYDGGGYSITNLSMNSTANNVGLFGYTDGAAISNVTVSGNVMGGSSTGGLIGQASDTMISNVFVSVDVSATTTSNYIGGLIGFGLNVSITRASAIGNVTGNAYVGGMIGYGYGTPITNSYATGNVTGNTSGDSIGGLIGYLDSDPIDANFPTTITNSYATGLVSGTTNRDGGLVGGICCGYVPTDISGSFWDTETSQQTSATGENTADGAFGKTTSEMKSISTFSGVSWAIVAGWEASAPPNKVWGICAAVNSGYPFLLGEFAEDPCGEEEGEENEGGERGPGFNFILDQYLERLESDELPNTL
jgi:hypothetical protein